MFLYAPVPVRFINKFILTFCSRCFTTFMAGASIKKSISSGETDDFGYNIAKDPVHVHDFQATVLHLIGIDHEQLVFKSQGRWYRLAGVAGKVVKGVLA